MHAHPHTPAPPQLAFQLITGYWVSQAVGTAAALGVYDALAAGPRTAAALADELGADPRALYRLMRALATVGVLAHDADGFALTPIGEVLRSDVPGSMHGMAVAQTAPGHWLPWGRLPEAVRSGRRQTGATLGRELFEYYAASPDEAGAFNRAMAGLSGLVAAEVARVFDATGLGLAIDVGGAEGTLLAALLAANPQLRGIVLDLPQVIAATRARLAAGGLAERCVAVAGDFFEAVPRGADVYILKQVLHDWDDDQCVTILRHCRAGLTPGGRVLVVEMVVPDDHRPSPAQLMDLNMLVMLPGRERTASEYAGLLATAGLRLAAVHHTHSPFQVIEAEIAT